MSDPCPKCGKNKFKDFGDDYSSCVNCGKLRYHQPELATVAIAAGNVNMARSVGRAIKEYSLQIREMVMENFEQISQQRSIGRSWKFIANKMPGGYGRAALDRHFTELKAEGFGK